jgi:hypothetical protein
MSEQSSSKDQSLPASLRAWADSNVRSAKYGPGLLRIAADEIERLTADLKREEAIVDRIWAIFGSPSYEELKGRSIYDLINNVVSERDLYKQRAEQAEMSAKLNANTIREMTEQRPHSAMPWGNRS